MRTVIALAATSLVLAAALFAQGQGMTPDRVRALLERLDQNKDGRIEKSEVPEVQQKMFQQMLNFADANHDGTLDGNERKAILERARNQAPAKNKAAQAQQVARMLQAMDKNHDGKVSREEFTSHAGYFDRLDANKDGFLVVDEVRPGMGNLLNRSLPFVLPPRTTTGLIPLPELGSGTYQDKPGGLYPGGSNTRPASHEKDGLRLAVSIRPLDTKGEPSDKGKIVLLSIGMSNTTMEYSAFQALANGDPGKNPKLVIVDGAQGGRTAKVIAQLDSPPGKQYWETIDERLGQAGVSRGQVQVAWMKQADGMPTSTTFPEYALTLEKEMMQIAQILKSRYPNIKLLYLSSRIYGGYATTPLNPEPYAYEGGFSVKWLIEKQLDGDPELNFDPARGPAKAPWLAWGPYLWADGTKGRSDGLTYVASDFADDGTHPSPSGRRKVAKQLLDFFKTDSTTKVWFSKAGG